MGQKSSFKSLSSATKAKVDALIRSGQYTVDGLVVVTVEAGEPRSRSSAGRYAKSVEEDMEDYRQAQNVAKVWAENFQSNPEGDIGVLLLQLLRSVAYKQVGKLSRSDKTSSMDIMLMGKALKDMIGTETLTIKKQEQIKALALKEAAERVGEAAKAQGLDEAQADFWRRKVLGIKT